MSPTRKKLKTSHNPSVKEYTPHAVETQSLQYIEDSLKPGPLPALGYSPKEVEHIVTSQAVLNPQGSDDIYASVSWILKNNYKLNEVVPGAPTLVANVVDRLHHHLQTAIHPASGVIKGGYIEEESILAAKYASILSTLIERGNGFQVHRSNVDVDLQLLPVQWVFDAVIRPMARYFQSQIVQMLKEAEEQSLAGGAFQLIRNWTENTDSATDKGYGAFSLIVALARSVLKLAHSCLVASSTGSLLRMTSSIEAAVFEWINHRVSGVSFVQWMVLGAGMENLFQLFTVKVPGATLVKRKGSSGAGMKGTRHWSEVALSSLVKDIVDLSTTLEVEHRSFRSIKPAISQAFVSQYRTLFHLMQHVLPSLSGVEREELDSQLHKVGFYILAHCDTGLPVNAPTPLIQWSYPEKDEVLEAFIVVYNYALTVPRMIFTPAVNMIYLTILHKLRDEEQRGDDVKFYAALSSMCRSLEQVMIVHAPQILESLKEAPHSVMQEYWKGIRERNRENRENRLENSTTEESNKEVPVAEPQPIEPEEIPEPIEPEAAAELVKDASELTTCLVNDVVIGEAETVDVIHSDASSDDDDSSSSLDLMTM